jgi:hypothetical protein
MYGGLDDNLSMRTSISSAGDVAAEVGGTDAVDA